MRRSLLLLLTLAVVPSACSSSGVQDDSPLDAVADTRPPSPPDAGATDSEPSAAANADGPAPDARPLGDAGMSDATSGVTDDAEIADATSEPGSPDAGDGDDAQRDATDAAVPFDAPQYALVGTYLGGIWAFAISPTSGALVKVAGSPFAAGARLYGIAVDPSGTFVYATDLDRKHVDGYRLAPDSGVLTVVPAAHVELTDGSPLSISMDPKGRFIYVATTGDDAIYGFSIDPQTGALTPVVRSPFLVSPFSPNGTLAIDPSGRFLYLTGTGGGIHAFSIDATSGALSEIPDSPFAKTTVLGGAMAFHPSGSLMYSVGRALNGFRVDADTGALTALSDSPVVTGVGSDPTATTVAIDPRGRYLYVTATFVPGPLADTVSGYAIDATTGMLAPVPGSPFPAAPFPYSVAIDRDGRFVYVGNDDSDLVSAFSIDQANGALKPVADSPFSAMGLQPEIVTVRPVPR
jgi:6-phosphogluconolactonase